MTAWINGRIRFDDDSDNSAQNTQGGGLDQPIAGVVVQLLNAQGHVVAQTTTNNHGVYQFDVHPGTYAIKVPLQNNNWQLAEKDVGPTNLDSDVDPDTGVSDYIHVGGGQTRALDVNYQPAGSGGGIGWLKGRLSFDDDKDDTEINTIGGGLDSGLAGRVVELYDLDGNKVAQSTTNGNGVYQFDVPAGQYKVKFPDVNGLVFADKDVGDIRYDSDANPDGFSDVVTIKAGKTTSQLDASYQHSPGQIGWLKGTVTKDDDFDDTAVNTVGGGQDEGIGGVVVELFKADGTFVARTTTDNNGMYQFDVPKGDYKIKFPEMDGMVLADKDVGNDQDDSDANPDGFTDVFSINGGQTKMDVDASYQNNTGWIKGRASKDVDNDETELNAAGGFDAGIAGITVQLIDPDGNVIRETTTNGNGEYQFDAPAGIYKVVFPVMDGMAFADKGTGVPAFDSDANSDGMTDFFEIVVGETIKDIDVSYQNDSTVAVDDAEETVQGNPVSIDVLANDFDEQGDAQEIQSFDDTSANGGTVTENADGTLEYTPAPGFSGTDTFEYIVVDASGATDTATVTITVKANDTDAVNDSAATEEGDPVSIDVLANDTDDQGDAQSIDSFDPTSANGGTITQNADGTLEYTPADGFSGEDTFEYTIVDANGATDTATVTVTVAKNTVDAVDDDGGAVEQGTPKDIDVLGNDTDDQGDGFTVTDVTDGAKGTVTINADGTVKYTPNAGAEGEDTFTYTITDDKGATDTATVKVVIGDNTVKAVDDTADAQAGEPVTIDVVANDSDPDGDDFTIMSVSDPANGTAEIVDGKIVYTPDVDFSGEETFTYMIKDEFGNVDTATITVTVKPNTTDAVNDEGTTIQGNPVSIDVLANDTDDQGDAQSIDSFDPTSANGGTVTQNADGTLEYTPADGFSGEDTFEYTVIDANGATDTATVTITVKANDTDAVNDSAATEEGDPVSIDVLANDTDDQGDAQSIDSFDPTSANGGTITQNADGTLEYTPAPGFSGEDTFEYTIVDANGATDTATVTVTVAKNTVDAVDDDGGAVEQGTPKDIDVLGNDTDDQGDGFTVTDVTDGAKGTVTINADGTVKYTPNAGAEGEDTFTYTITDDKGATDTATVKVVIGDNTVKAVDDTADAQAGEPVTIDVVANDSDPDGDDFTIMSVSDPANGTAEIVDGKIVYTPDVDFSGEETFTYMIKDEFGNVDTATITVTVKPNTTDAVNDEGTTIQGNPVSIDVLANDTDDQGDAQSIDSFDPTSANGGTVTQNADGTLEYTPADGFSGEDTFEYTVIDANGATDTATVTITVKANDTDAVNDSAATEEGDPVSIDVLANDTDDQGDAQSIDSFDPTSANGGTITQNADGTLEYTPAPGFSGEDTFEYTIVDANGATDTATVTVTVAKNTVDAVDDDGGAVEQGTPKDIDVLGNDTDDQGDGFTVTDVTDGAKGTVTINADGTVKYTPNAGAEGEDTFTYTITDDKGATDTATVKVVIGDNTVKAVDDTADAQAGEPVTIDVVANDSDPDGDDFTIMSVSDPANGTAEIVDGKIVYTPDVDFSGEETFTYMIKDEFGNVDTATITVTVKPNTTDAVNDEGTTIQGNPVSIDVLANDTDDQGDAQSIDSFDPTSANGGTVTQNADGTLEYTPADGFSGEDTFEYTVIDANGATDTATVTITVKANDTDAVNDSAATEEGDPVSIDVLANDTDDQGDAQSIDSFDPTSANGGTITQNADGTLEYTPAPGFSGEDTFEYTIVDANGATDTATVTVTVAKNTVDAVDDDGGAVEQGTPKDIDVLGNDTDDQGDGFTVTDVTDGAKGTVTINADGTVKYTPNAGAEGEDTFTYTITDDKGATDTATVKVVIGDNTVKAVDDTADAQAGEPVTIDVVANDSDPDGDDFTIMSVSDPANGTAEIVDGKIVYTPDVDFSGEETFTYMIKDEFGNVDTATITVTVKPNTTDAVNDEATTDFNTPVLIDVLANDTDDQGDAQEVDTFDGTSANGGTITQNADGTLNYTPADGFTGEDTFEYTVIDENGATDTATVTVTVGADPNTTDAVNDEETTTQDFPVTIDVLANDTDPEGDDQSVESFDPTSAEGGTITQNADGELVYTPPAGFTGTDTFEYTVIDENGATDTATVTVIVNAPNDTDAVNDEATTDFNSPVIIDVLANDTDDQGDAQEVDTFDGTSANGGTITQNADGTLNYTPADGFTGEDTFEYTVIDENGATDTATVTVTVGADPNTTDAVNDEETTTQDFPVTIDVLANDTDPEGDDQSVESFDPTSAEGGTITQNADGELVYTPPAGFTGTDTFEYTVIDENGATDTATVTVTVNAPNDTDAVNDEATTDFNTPVLIDVLANDTDDQGDAQEVDTFDGTSANGGTITQNADGTLNYTPADGFTGEDTFEYTVIDENGATDTATVTVTVGADPNTTDAVNDEETTTQDFPVTIDVLANDTDPEGDDQSVESFDPTSAEGGTITQNADGELVYTPPAGFTGTDTFEYTVIDENGATDTATVTVIVNAPNDTDAVNDEATTDFNSPVIIDVLANDTDDQGDAQEVDTFDGTSANGGTITQNADGTLNYTPADGFTGEDTFEYTVIDENGATDTATVTVTVGADPNTTDAVNDEETTTQDFPVTIDVLANDTDPEGDDQSVESFDPTSAEGGTITQNADGELVYTPPAGFTGTDTFEYTVIDENGATDTATVTVTVNAPNDTDAVNDEATTDFNTPVLIDVLANDTDDQGDAQEVDTFDGTSANGGTITQNADGTLNYTPADGFTGEDTFEYTVIDENGATDTATVTVTVGADPNTTDAVNDEETTTQDFPVTIDVLANDTDPEGDDQSVESFDPTSAEGGTITQNADGELVYTPPAGFTGTDTFEYTVIDEDGATDTATVTVTVNAPNDTDAVNDEATTDFNTPVLIDVLANDTDDQGDAQEVDTFDGTSANGGTITQNADGTLNYTPADGFTGEDTFEYTVIDENGATDTATVTVTVAPKPNTDPDAVDDTDTTTVDTPVVIDVLGNDTDPENDDLTVTEVTDGLNGTVTIGADGKPVYTPNPGFIGMDMFTYTISDGNGGTDTATVKVTIEPKPNTDPDAVDDTDTTTVDTPVVIDVLGNDTDPENDDLTVTEVTDGLNGTVTIGADGKPVYTPNPGFIGMDMFTYTISDGNGGTDTATVKVTIEPKPNTDPDAVDDTDTTTVDTPVVIDVLGNDTDPENDDLTVTDVTDGLNGTVTIGADGKPVYTPNPGFIGMDMFTYTISDGNGGTDTATVKVTIEPKPNTDPDAVDDTDTTTVDTPVVIDVLGNDTDPENDDLTVTEVTDGLNGTVTIGADGKPVYTPNPGFIGMDMFTYTISDGNGGTDTATVKVTIEPKPNTDPDAVDDTDTTTVDTPVVIDVLGNDTDPENDDLTVTDVTDGLNGTVTIGADGKPVYTPNPGFIGMDTFTYTISDGNGGTDTATVKVTIDPKPNTDPDAKDDTDTTTVDTPVVIDVLGNDTDPENDDLTVTDVTDGLNGTVTIGADGKPVYTPNPGFIGMDTFTYTISDGNGGTDTATVKVTIDPKPNTDPDAVDDTDTTAFNTPVVIDVLGNDTDPEGDPLTVVAVTDGANGTVTIGADGKPVYTPNPGFIGMDTFTYTISDGNGGTDTATVKVTIDPPKISDPDAVDDMDTTAFNTPVVVDVLGNDTDPEGDPLTVVEVTDGANGTVTIGADGKPVYTPNDGFTGMDTFTYTISDGNGGTDTATVKITVGDKPNDPPDAVDDNASTSDGKPIDINVLGNDTDPDGDTLMVIGVDDGAKGTTTILANGQVRYTPLPGATGMDMFTYTIKDGEGGFDTAKVTVDLGDPVENKPPVAEDDMGTGLAGDPIMIDVLANDSDPEGDTLMITETTDGANGTVSQNADGKLVYTPNDANFTGMDTFTYTIKDGNGGFDTATVKVTIEGKPNEMIMGTEGNDKRIDGTDGDDQMFGKGGHDCLYATAGDDLMDGGSGYDMVLYQSGSASDFMFEANADGSVTVTGGGYGTDLLVDIESIYFEESQQWFKIEDLVDAH